MVSRAIAGLAASLQFGPPEIVRAQFQGLAVLYSICISA
jgi:hypothetical protein